MEAQQSQTKLLIETKYCKVHYFKDQKRNSITSGTLQLLQSLDEESTTFIKVQNFYLNITPDIQLIKVKYQKSISLFFQNPNDKNIMSFSFPNINSDPNDAKRFQRLEELLKDKQSIVNFDQDCTNQELIEKIKTAYPQISKKEVYKPQNVKNAVKKVSYGIGGVFGTISSFFQGTGKKIQDNINQKTQKFSKQSISQQNKEKWEATKTKAAEINDTVTGYVKPVSKKGSQWMKSIKNSWNTSDYKAVKVLKDLSKTTSTYINKGFQKGSGKQHHDDINVIPSNKMQDKRASMTQRQRDYDQPIQYAKVSYPDLSQQDKSQDQRSGLNLLND